MNEEPNHIDQLLTRHLLGETSVEENNEIENWINSSGENKRYFEGLKKIWNNTASIKDFAEIDAEVDWKKVKSKVRFEKAAVVKSLIVEKETTFFPYFYKIAASLLLVVGLGWISYQYLGSEIITIETAATEEKEVTLPDGSKAFLNANSEIAYNDGFSDGRNIELKGEAFFEVVKNVDKPFKVKTKGTVTEVLGTSFNVNDKQQKVIVTLITGKVAFYEEKKSSSKILMKPGEEAIFSSGKITKQENNNSNALAWRKDLLTFRDKKLSSVIEDLESYFNVKIEVQNNEILNCNYTGTFEKPKLNTVLEVIEQTLNIQIKDSNGKYVINGLGCS